MPSCRLAALPPRSLPSWIVPSFLLAACSPTRTAPPPDLVLHHGKIFTGDSAAPWAQALAITGDRVVAVGADSVIVTLAGSTTQQVDLGGRVVVPGFNDAHDHIVVPLGGVSFATSSDPTPDPPFKQVAESVAAIAKRAPAGTWITTAVGERILSDPAARRAALDRIAPRHPVKLQAWSGHGTIWNGPALAIVGLTDTTPDPIGGRLERDAGKRLSGLAEEYSQFMPSSLGPAPTDSAARAAFVARADEAIRFGITSIQNMTNAFEPTQIDRLLPGLELPVRIRVIRFPGLTEPRSSVAEWSAITSRSGRTAVSGTKWILDGTPVERLAVLRAPYSDRPGWYGRLDIPPDTLRAILSRAVRDGDQPIIHAVGDSAIKLVLMTMAAVAPDSVWQRLRLRIEHGEGLMPDLFPEAKRLGVIVCQNPTHFALTALAPARYGPTRLAVLQPLKSLLTNGIALCFGSDGPLNPFLNIMLAAMHPDNPKEAISV
ncbi:MAG: amidohydrolase family protein, partial [Gemmatimonadota bacterium]